MISKERLNMLYGIIALVLMAWLIMGVLLTLQAYDMYNPVYIIAGCLLWVLYANK